MLKRNRQGQVVRVFAYSGAMFKHSSFKAEPQDETLSLLDACAHKKVKPMGPGGLVIRKKAS